MSAPTLVDAFADLAAEAPDALMFRFLVSGDAEGETAIWSRQDVLRYAQRTAVALQEAGLEGERVLLVYLPGIDFAGAFLGCLFAGAVAVPAYPPDPMRLARTAPRLRAIANDAGVSAMLTTSPLKMMLPLLAEHAPDVAALRCISTDDLDSDPEVWRRPDSLSARQLAFLQYTSGSTGDPKGVMINHEHIVAQLRIAAERTNGTSASHVVNWLPQYHDLGLMTGFMMPAQLGSSATILSPVDFLKRPLRWLHAISKFEGTHAGGPDFGYALCARKATPEDVSQLNLQSWEVAWNAAEPLRASTIDAFNQTFGPCGFSTRAVMPGYGLAEATMGVTWAPHDKDPARFDADPDALAARRAEPAQGARSSALYGHGPSGEFDVAIVDPDTCGRVGPRDIGEIWVRGPSVGVGYWNRPELSERVFGARIAGTGEGPYMRTGDLGCVLDGELYITGRISDLIILRGRNYYPQDIEASVEEAHPAIRPGCGAAFSIDEEGEERLVVVFEAKSDALDDVIAAVRTRVVEDHEIAPHAVVLIKHRSAPKTSSGKIQRRALKSQFVSGELKIVGEWVRPAPAVARHDADTLRAWLRAEVAARTGTDPDDHATFASLGLDSKAGVELTGALEEKTGTDISVALLYDHPSIDALARHLSGDTGVGVESVGVRGEPIAIVGLGCVFPGADGPDAYWRLLEGGVDAIGEVPPDRFDIDRFYSADPTSPGKLSTRWGGFIDDPGGFDAEYFGIAPREADAMDPQQRLLLQTAVDALEDAGIPCGALAGSRTGTFIGISSSEYGTLQFRDLGAIDGYTGTGSAMSIAANRLSYTFDTRGPSLSVDTACSSSLAAVHLAVQSLRSGECNLALAGGVSLILSPAVTINFSKASAMAADGRCKPFDARADGYVRSEGAGVVVLKPLSAALADGDRVHAVIRGTAMSQDGRTNGLMAPSGKAQEAVIRAACLNAGVRRADVTYNEAHGTGTALGDVIEAEALAAAYRPEGGAPLLIGSAKSNIGHLEAAAGIAGLIKTALSVNRSTLPESVHFETPNPRIAFDDLALRVCTETGPWPAGRPRLAGVSSFGFGGTNVHAIVEAPPPRQVTGREGPHVLCLSARSADALSALVREHGLRDDDEAAFAATCAASAMRRDHHRFRVAFAAATQADLKDALTCYRPRPGQHGARVVFVFGGQGGQWSGMGRTLYESNAVFRETIDECAEALGEVPLLAVIRGECGLDDISIIQPAIFAIQVALSRALAAYGVVADSVIGHSMGEVAAACVAGGLSLNDAAKVIARRSKLMKRVAGRGAMLFAEIDGAAAQRLAGDYPGVSVAAHNGPQATVLSGDKAALESIRTQLEERDTYTRWVKVDVASHSAMVDELGPALSDALADITPSTPQMTMFSTVRRRAIEGAELDAGYWMANLRQPVYFSDMVAAATTEPAVVIELGPHPTLAATVSEGSSARVISTLRRDEDDRLSFAQTLAELYTSGVQIDWAAQYGPRVPMVSLPRYPWQREQFWSAAVKTAQAAPAGPSARPASTSGHPVFEAHIALAGGDHVFEGTYRLDEHGWIAEHEVQGRPVLPGAAHAEAMLFVSEKVFGLTALEDLRLEHPVMVEDSAAVQLLARSDRTLEVFVRSDDEWSRVAGARAAEAAELPTRRKAEFAASCPVTVSRDEVVAAQSEAGLRYGPMYAVLEGLRRGDGRAFAELSDSTASAYERRIVLLDALFQLGALDQRGVLASVASIEACPGSREASWACADAEGAVLHGEKGPVMRVQGVQARALTNDASLPLYEVTWRSVDVPKAAVSPPPWIVLEDDDGVAATVAEHLRSAGCDVTSMTADGLNRSPDVLTERAYAGILSFSGGSLAEPLALVKTVLQSGLRDFPAVWLVTTGAQSVEGSAVRCERAPTWGFGSVLANEHPELQPVLFDLDPDGSSSGPELLAAAMLGELEEPRLAQREGRLLGARLVSAPPNGGAEVRAAKDARFVLKIAPTIGQLGFQATEPGSLGPDDVEIRVRATGLNFSDVMKVLGVYPGPGGDVLGGECAGEVSRIGANITEFAVGDDVVAFAPHSFASHVVTSAHLVAKRPGGLSAAEAACRPSAMLTARYGLEKLARVAAGDRVLVHSASGAVGLAAIEVAKRAGAVVIATAGSEPRREFLRARGCSLVFDSRSTAFAEALVEGVDVVFSAQVDAVQRASLALLRPGGRFVDLSKRPAYEGGRVELSALRNNAAYFVVDAAALLETDPEYCGRVLRESMSTQVDIPSDVFRSESLRDAFSHMATAQHIGKVVVTIDDTAMVKASAPGYREDATYLITGGLGGLGLALARHLSESGAGRVVLAGRSPPSPEAQAVISALPGVSSQIVDVVEPARVTSLVQSLENLAGIYHLAGVLDDAPILEQTWERSQAVLAPKVAGAWNLHEATENLDLDHFVLFGSASSVIGTPGQSAYAAANAYLDALAVCRRQQGLRGTCVAWGPWSRAGMVADEDYQRRFRHHGVASFDEQHGLRLLEQISERAYVQVVAMQFDARQWAQSFPRAASSNFYGALQRSDQVEDSRHEVQAIAALPEGDRQAALEKHLVSEAAAVLRLPANRVHPQRPLKELGLDSLMTLEFRNRIELNLGVRLSATIVWRYPTIAQLAGYLLETLGLSPRRELESVAEPEPEPELSDEEGDALLALLDAVQP